MKKPSRQCNCGSGLEFRYCCINTLSNSDRKTKVQQQMSDARSLEFGGDLEASIQLYQRIVARNQYFHPAYWQMGLLQIEVGDTTAGLRALKEATRYHSNPTSLVETVVTKMMAIGKTEQADVFLSDMLKKHSGNVNVLMALASKQEKMGNLKKSKITLDKISALSPNSSLVAAARARCLRRQGKVQEAEKLLFNFLHEAKDNSNQMHHLLREQGFVQEKLGEYKSAFKAMTLAGELRLAQPDVASINSSHRYSELEQYRNWVREGGLENQLEKPETENTQHVFLVGFPRSGTTLTEQILASHTDVKSSEERELLYHATRTLQKKYPRATSIVELLDVADKASFQLARKAYWASVAKHLGSDFDVLIDKLPLNIACLPLINKIFPNAKIIVALRDPRDVCLSCFFQDFRLNASMKNFLSWQSTLQFYSAVMNFWIDIRDLITLEYKEIRYEDTVSNFPHEIKTVFEFLDIEWQDSIKDFTEFTSSHYVDTPSFQAIRDPVNTKAIGKSKNYPEARVSAENYLQDIIVSLGY